MKEKYHPEQYWSTVAGQIKSREDHNVIAGDDEPYYRYKRTRFLDLLRTVDFNGKSVLEIGCGPGGNLKEIHESYSPKNLTGVDISNAMIDLAKSNLPEAVEIIRINGTELPFKDQSFDIVFTATVLQHNTDEKMLKAIISELCRVSNNKVYLFERVESEIMGDDLCLGRPLEYYASLMNAHNFHLVDVDFIDIGISYYVSGAIRKLLNPATRREGEPLTRSSVFLQNITLPVTKRLDNIFSERRNLAKMEFVRK